jgi:hypothetical protein
MIRVFDLISAAFTANRIQKAVALSGKINKKGLEPALLLESMACVRVKVDPVFDTSIPTSMALPPDRFRLKHLAEFLAARAGYVDKLCDEWHGIDVNQLCTHNVCLFCRDMMDDPTQVDYRYNPLFLASKAFVSGGTPDGVVEALSRSCRTRTVPTIDPKIFLAAYLHTMSRIPPMSNPPTFSDQSILDLPRRPGQSAGYLPVKVHLYEYEECIIKFTNTGKQGEAFQWSFEELKKLVHRVREGVQREKTVPEHWFPTFLSKISVKPEIRSAGSNTSKTRIIYITCLIYLMLDTILFHEYVKNSYQRNGCMIGHQWKKGGATHLANYLGWARDDTFYVTMDVKHFDQSALASVIELIILMPLMSLKNDDTPEYRMTKAFIVQRAHHMACKIAKWEGREYRLIIGQVFSGLYLTSWLDTIYMILCVTAAITAIYHDIKRADPVRAQDFKFSFMRRVQYGDNSLYAFPMRYIDDICGGRTPQRPLGRLQDLLETMVGLELKPEETYMFTPDDSGISPLFTILKPVFENKQIVRYDVKRQGPEFLKRKFVCMNIGGKTHIMPWRSEDDFYTKSCITANFGEFAPDKWTSKYVGLMVDTMGTNDVAYRTMKHMFLSSLQGSSTETVEEKVRSFFDRLPKKYELDLNHPTEYGSIDVALDKTLARTGLSINEAYILALNKNKLVQEFVYDDEWRKNWAMSYKLNLYNPDGTIRMDASYEINWYKEHEISVPNYHADEFDWVPT